ncbi:MAG: hypothetical protein LBS21_05940 [Clostridiales bacterium]|jgi:hypothetical protein|nr:hypothetical protein [Clostridiales bacterium]
MGKKKISDKAGVYLTYPALKIFMEYFGYASEQDFNSCEQIAALGGEINGDTIIVRQALPLPAAAASAGHVAVPGELWFWAMQVFGKSGAKLVGSAHTHPGSLNVFMSSSDMEANSLLFPDGVSIIVNPHRQIIGAFNKNGRKIPIILK